MSPQTPSERSKGRVARVLAQGGKRVPLLLKSEDVPVFDALKHKGYGPSINAIAIKAAREALERMS